MQTVFVSSTYLDLQPERAAVRDAILRLQCRFSGMEYFGSDPERPLKVSLDFVSRATIYLGIIAHRYGSTDSQTGKSITQLEYEAARKSGIPTLIYFKDPLALVEPTSQYIDFDLQHRECLGQFRTILQQECVVQWFTSATDLAAKVTSDIAKHLLGATHKTEDSSCREQTDEMSGAASAIHMIGPAAVGKTVYGCMLLHEPVATLCRKGLTLEVDRDNSRLLQGYEQLRKGRWASYSYVGSRESVEIVLYQRRWLKTTKHRIRFLDTSGEEWYHTTDPEYHYGNHENWSSLRQDLARSSGLALFLETQLGNNIGPSLDPLYANIVGILGQPSGAFQGPVAVILTKCDLFPDLLHNREEVTAFLEREYPLTTAQIRHRLKKHALFATSSVGGVDKNGNPVKLEPKGIWESMLWLVESL